MVMMISDETGEGKMTVHQILPGIMICFTDMHMEQCMSEFELNSCLLYTSDAADEL